MTEQTLSTNLFVYDNATQTFEADASSLMGSSYTNVWYRAARIRSMREGFFLESSDSGYKVWFNFVTVVMGSGQSAADADADADAAAWIWSGDQWRTVIHNR